MLKALQKYFGDKPIDCVMFTDEYGMEYKIKTPEITNINDHLCISFEFSCEICWMKNVIAWIEVEANGKLQVREINPIYDPSFYRVFEEQGYEPPFKSLVDTLNLLLEEYENE